jgi:hypothetical protein
MLVFTHIGITLMVIYMTVMTIVSCVRMQMQIIKADAVSDKNILQGGTRRRLVVRKNKYGSGYNSE